MTDRNDEEHPSARDQNATNPEPDGAHIVESPLPFSAKPETKAPKWDDEERRYYGRYLCTQRAIVFITLGGIIVALCTLFVLNENVAQTHRQASAAATQARIASDEFESTQRAWIGVDSVEVKNLTRIPDNAYSFSIFVNGKNFGHSPATNIKVAWDIAETPDDLAIKAKGICGGRKFGTFTSDITLFPDKTFPFALGTSAPVGEENPKPIWLIGCFIYGDAFRKCEGMKDCRTTRFCYVQSRDEAGLPKYLLRYQYNDAH